MKINVERDGNVNIEFVTRHEYIEQIDALWATIEACRNKVNELGTQLLAQDKVMTELKKAHDDLLEAHAENEGKTILETEVE